MRVVCQRLILREHAEPGFWQVAGGRRGDAVATDVQARTQRGELAGNRGGLARLPGTEGKLEVVQNLIGRLLIERAHQGNAALSGRAGCNVWLIRKGTSRISHRRQDGMTSQETRHAVNGERGLGLDVRTGRTTARSAQWSSCQNVRCDTEWPGVLPGSAYFLTLGPRCQGLRRGRRAVLCV